MMRPFALTMAVYAVLALLLAQCLFFSMGFAAIALYSFGSDLVGEVTAGIILSVVSLSIPIIGVWILYRRMSHTSHHGESSRDHQPGYGQLKEMIKTQPMGAVCIAFVVGWLYECMPTSARGELTKHLDLKDLTELINKELNDERTNETPLQENHDPFGSP